jgi:hypothetical protein
MLSSPVPAAEEDSTNLPWKHVGFGLGLDAMRVEIEANGSDYPGVDFKGSVEFNYLGAQLYVKVFL